MKDYSFLPEFDELIKNDHVQPRTTHPLWQGLIKKARDDQERSSQKGRGPDRIKLTIQQENLRTENDIFLVGRPEVLVFPLSDGRCAVGVHKFVIGQRPGWFCSSWGEMDDEMDAIGNGGQDPDRVIDTYEYHDGSDLLILPAPWSGLIGQAIQAEQQTGIPLVWPNDPATGRTLIEATQESCARQLDARELDSHETDGVLTVSLGSWIWRTVLARIFILALLEQGVEMPGDMHNKEQLLDNRLTELLDQGEKQRIDGVKRNQWLETGFADARMKQFLVDKPALWWVYVDRDILAQASDDTGRPQPLRPRGRSL